MPRDLKDPPGWRFSSFRKILLLRFSDRCSRRVSYQAGAPYHPAASESTVDSTKGVWRQGLRSLIVIVAPSFSN